VTVGLYTVRFGAALLFGCAIGIERQWRQRMAGTRTHGLVAAGASAFVMSGFLIQGDSSGLARIVSYVVSGVGFLGAGVIFKEGMQVRGLNTAATVWCSAAVGVLSGLGYAEYALVTTIGVLMTNILLRPLAYKLHPRAQEATARETNYHFELVCKRLDEARMRGILMQTVSRLPVSLYALASEDIDNSERMLIDADLRCAFRNDESLEQLVARMSLEDGVTSVSWRVLPLSGKHEQTDEHTDDV
jgi:putative Mg2+ transporter-C (MgtC) family protein